jgi:hypothetical protein
VDNDAIKTPYDSGIYTVFFGALISLPLYLTAKDIEAGTYAPGVSGLARLGGKVLHPIASLLGTKGVLLASAFVIGLGLFLLFRAWQASSKAKEVAERQMRIERSRRSGNRDRN